MNEQSVICKNRRRREAKETLTKAGTANLEGFFDPDDFSLLF